MKTRARLFVFALVASGPLAAPAQTTPPRPAKVLLLDNHEVIDGDAVERVGDRYRIQRGASETWLPAARALAACADRAAAYQFLRAKADLKNPDERVRLAMWCGRHGLRTEAVAEANAARELRPDHLATRRLLDELLRAAAKPPQPPPPAPQPAPAPAPEPPPPDVSPEAFALFTTKVQPILMNACANCHANNRGGGLKLVRVFGS